MRMPATTATGIFLVLASLLGGLAAGSTAASAELLTEEMLKHYIPGAQINLDTPLGSVIPVTYEADGSLHGKAGAVAFFLGSQTDRGKWWISRSRLCQQWKTWFNGRKNCVKVYRRDDNRISWIDQDGDKGTGTIVALRKSEPPPRAKTQPVRSEPPPEKRATQVAAMGPVQLPHKARAEKDVATKVVPPQPVSRQAHTPARAATPPVAPPVLRPPVPAKNPEQRLARAATVAPRPATRATPVKAVVKRPSVTPVFRVVNVPQDDVLNVRSGPDPTTRIVAVIPPRGSGIMKLGGCNGDWCPVRYESGQGWVHRYFIAPENQRLSRVRSAPNPITYRVVRVAANDVLNLRRRPDPDARIVSRIPSSGRRIHLTGYCVGEWCPVRHGRDSGWAHRYYLTLEY